MKGPTAGRRGEALYALASLGAHLGFMPLLILLLPRRVLAIAPDQTLASLSALLLLGGLVASAAHIVAGAISDAWVARRGDRRAVIGAGLAGLVGAYGLMANAQSLGILAGAVVAFQLALNLMFAPLGALMTDYIPDARKGRVAGWLNAGLPLSILMVSGLSRYAPVDSPASFLAVAALVAGLVLPLLIVWPFAARAAGPPARDAAALAQAMPLDRADLLLAWVARLLMQLGASLLVNYIFLYLAGLRRTASLAAIPEPTVSVGILSLVASAMAVIGAVAAGHGSDARRRRRLPMIAAAMVAATALAALSAPGSFVGLLIAYGLFQAALTAYLAIDAALVAQLVGRHPRRGAVLGFMNLTNTVPGVLSAVLALVNVARTPDAVALSRVLLACAAASVVTALLVSRIRSLR